MLTLADGSSITVPFMNSDILTVPFISEADTQGIILPYNDGNLAFMALRPTNGTNIADFAANFKADTLSHMVTLAKETPVKLSMPKFTADYSFDMKEALTAMGLGDAFDISRANFSAMTEANDLFISEAKQKTKVEVNEAGTEAAASSSVGMSMKSMPVQEDAQTLVLDSPYLYVIFNLDDNAPLFMGVMNSPAL
ncbi:MAG: serpin family protein [Eubacterium sp.]